MVQRWDEATQGLPSFALPSQELKGLVYGGVPAKHRTALWTELALNHKGLAGDISKLQGQASDDDIRRIGQDLPRTQPDRLDHEQLHSLQRVLTAYAAWNPAVGYCQGMNFMAAVFINLGFSDTEAFAGLSFLIEDVCPGCHSADLSGFHRDAEVLDRLVQRFLPSLHSELAHVGVPLNLLAIDHFMSLTSRSWPLEATVRLWDIILVEGPRALFASFLALLELFMPRIGMRAHGMPDDSMTAFDAMENFKRESRHGVVSQMGRFWGRVRKYAQLIPDHLIEELRADVFEELRI